MKYLREIKITICDEGDALPVLLVFLSSSMRMAKLGWLLGVVERARVARFSDLGPSNLGQEGIGKMVKL